MINLSNKILILNIDFVQNRLNNRDQHPQIDPSTYFDRMAIVKIFDLWVVEARSSLIMKNGYVQKKYAMDGGARSPQPEGVRRPAVAQIAATIMVSRKQQNRPRRKAPIGIANTEKLQMTCDFTAHQAPTSSS